MINGEGNTINNDIFKLTANVLSDPAGAILWEKTFQIKTDDDGWFGFDLEEFDDLFENDKSELVDISVNLVFTPLTEGNWRPQGNDFPVSYTITRIIRNDSILFTMTRVPDKIKLTIMQQDYTLFYYDTYPFSWLQGGFILSPASIPANVETLQSFIVRGASRGIKGGFAVGGYSKKR